MVLMRTEAAHDEIAVDAFLGSAVKGRFSFGENFGRIFAKVLLYVEALAQARVRAKAIRGFRRLLKLLFQNPLQNGH